MAAGGTVATLQSIGAVGLGLSGTCAVMGAGSALGGAVIGTTGLLGWNNAAGPDGSTYDHEDNDDINAERFKSPICRLEELVRAIFRRCKKRISDSMSRA